MCVTRPPEVEEGPRAWQKCEATNPTTSPKTSCSRKRALSTGSSKGLTSCCQVGKSAVPREWTLPPARHRRLCSAAPASPGFPAPQPCAGGALGLGHRGGKERTAGLQRGCRGSQALWARSPRPPSQTSTRCPRLWRAVTPQDEGQERSLGPQGARNLATPSVAWAASPSLPAHPPPSQRNV